MSIYHLDTFTIKAFRGIREMSLTGLGRINLLIGANNSGKTSVLEAVQAFCNPENPDKWVKIANTRNAASSLSTLYSPVDCLNWLFPRKSSETPEMISLIELLGEGDCPVREVSASMQPVYGVPPEEDVAKIPSPLRRLSGWSAKIGSSEGIQFSLHSVRTGALGLSENKDLTERYWTNLPFIRKTARETGSFPVASILGGEYRANEIYADSYSRLKKDQEQDVLDIARVFDPGITRISVGSRDGQPYLKVEHTRMGEVPLMVFGDGMKRVLFIASSLLAARDGFLLLDEIESGIHTFALADVMKWLFRVATDMNIQVFATTHSLDTVDAMLKASEGYPGEFVTYRLASEGGEAKRIGDKALYDLRVNGGLEIR